MFAYFMYTYGNQIMLVVLCAIFGAMGHMLKKLAGKYLDDQTKRSVARAVVQFVEQVWQKLHGKDKLRKALETAEIMLRKKGIPFDAEEMEVLIEAAVAEFNEVFKKPLLAENTASAVRVTQEFTAE